MTDAKPRIAILREAVKEYGAAAFENLMRCKGLADAVIEGLPEYLGVSEDCVRKAPPAGAFDPNKDYGDEAYSFMQRPVIILEPVRCGIVLTVRNIEDEGSLWLRTHMSIEVSGDRFHVFIAQRPVMRFAAGNIMDALPEIQNEIYQEFLQTFHVEIMEFNDQRFKDGIGFIPNKEQ